MRLTIEGYDLPGRTFCASDGSPYDNVQVGVQINKDPDSLVAGDSDSARWAIDIEIAPRPGGEIDFRGPAVQGKRGDRFIYLTWGNVGSTGDFEMFRRAKLMLNRIDPSLVNEVIDGEHTLAARVRLSDNFGTPRCARVDPPDVEWAVT